MQNSRSPTQANIPVNGTELRRRRQMLGMTQLQLAAACGMSFGYISSLESGRRTRMTPPRFARLCDMLGVTDRSQLIAP